MKEMYMIVRTVDILIVGETKLSSPCYQIVKRDHETPESAYAEKETYEYPENYIVTKYWC